MNIQTLMANRREPDREFSAFIDQYQQKYGQFELLMQSLVTIQALIFNMPEDTKQNIIKDIIAVLQIKQNEFPKGKCHICQKELLLIEGMENEINICQECVKNG